jgi:hypothetical protein
VIPVATTTAIDTTWEVVKWGVEVGRVEIDIGELGVVQPAFPEGGHDLIEAGADP